MTTFLGFLRGINVGASRRVAMADLRAILTDDLGHEDVTTYLQSGNVAFSATGTGPKREAALAADLRRAIEARLGLDVGVVVRRREDVQALVDANPFPEEAKREPAKLLLVLLEGEVDRKALAAVDVDAFAPELVEVGKRALYVFYANGIHTSKLAPALDKVVGPVGTARNWNTVTKLLDRTAPD
jgi:uncharacterized protein (DUF1697 family)